MRDGKGRKEGRVDAKGEEGREGKWRKRTLECL